MRREDKQNLSTETMPQRDDEQNSAVFQKSSGGLSRGASQVLVLDSYKNGVAASLHRAKEINEHTTSALDAGDQFFLRSKELKELSLPPGKFFVYREDVRSNLARLFEKLHKAGTLGSTVVYLGVNTDPFHVFHTKFANSMLCLELLEKYPCARVVVQSRSKMMLSALSMLKALEGRTLCVIPMESHNDGDLRRYTSSPSTVKERLKTAIGLRAQSVPVCFSVSPIIPHGSTRGDTWKFAEILTQFSDKILLTPLCNGSKVQEAQVKKSALALKLEADNHLSFLRPDATHVLRDVIEQLSPSHLDIPAVLSPSGEQLDLFAA